MLSRCCATYPVMTVQARRKAQALGPEEPRRHRDPKGESSVA
jgi:hypothetical protein